MCKGPELGASQELKFCQCGWSAVNKKESGTGSQRNRQEPDHAGACRPSQGFGTLKRELFSFKTKEIIVTDEFEVGS